MAREMSSHTRNVEQEIHREIREALAAIARKAAIPEALHPEASPQAPPQEEAFSRLKRAYVDYIIFALLQKMKGLS